MKRRGEGEGRRKKREGGKRRIWDGKAREGLSPHVKSWRRHCQQP